MSDHVKETATENPVRFAVLTISDRAARGTYVDATGPALIELLQSHMNATLVTHGIIEDDEETIVQTLMSWCDTNAVDFVLTNGGTGLAARDVTPEATLRVIERPIPGMAEAMRAEGRRKTPLADLSRQVVGQRKGTIIANVPGSPKGAQESLAAILDVLPHAIALVRVPS